MVLPFSANTTRTSQDFTSQEKIARMSLRPVTASKADDFRPAPYFGKIIPIFGGFGECRRYPTVDEVSFIGMELRQAASTRCGELPIVDQAPGLRPCLLPGLRPCRFMSFFFDIHIDCFRMVPHIHVIAEHGEP
jgi:hypothetical protein